MKFVSGARNRGTFAILNVSLTQEPVPEELCHECNSVTRPDAYLETSTIENEAAEFADWLVRHSSPTFYCALKEALKEKISRNNHGDWT